MSDVMMILREKEKELTAELKKIQRAIKTLGGKKRGRKKGKGGRPKGSKNKKTETTEKKD